MPSDLVRWPDGRRFAFSIFDDPDAQTTDDGRLVYACLAEHGLRTTKAVWPVRGPLQPSDRGGTCDEAPYLEWVRELRGQGFEIAFHNATLHTSERDATIRALERFRELFDAPPTSMANHFFSEEGIYWGDARLTGPQRLAYNILTRWKNAGRFRGHIEGDRLFWGDVCQREIRYVRNFVFADVNTLNACPFMPYHDPLRPYVNLWFAASEGANRPTFVRTLTPDALDRLEDEGGACIMYTHFGHGYVEKGRLREDFKAVIADVSRRNGWFVPVANLLDYLRASRPQPDLTAAQRGALERRWLAHKVRFGTA